jgi:hypothetical protein
VSANRVQRLGSERSADSAGALRTETEAKAKSKERIAEARDAQISVRRSALGHLGEIGRETANANGTVVRQCKWTWPFPGRFVVAA